MLPEFAAFGDIFICLHSGVVMQEAFYLLRPTMGLKWLLSPASPLEIESVATFLVIFGGHMNILFIITVKIIVCRLVKI